MSNFIVCNWLWDGGKWCLGNDWTVGSDASYERNSVSGSHIWIVFWYWWIRLIIQGIDEWCSITVTDIYTDWCRDCESLEGQILDVIYEKKSWLVGLSMHNWNVHWKLNINFDQKAFLKHLIQYLFFLIEHMKYWLEGVLPKHPIQYFFFQSFSNTYKMFSLSRKLYKLAENCNEKN